MKSFRNAPCSAGSAGSLVVIYVRMSGSVKSGYRSGFYQSRSTNIFDYQTTKTTCTTSIISKFHYSIEIYSFPFLTFPSWPSLLASLWVGFGFEFDKQKKNVLGSGSDSEKITSLPSLPSWVIWLPDYQNYKHYQCTLNDYIQLIWKQGKEG